MQQVDFSPINHIEIRDGQARIAERHVKVKMVISRLIHGEPTTIEAVMAQSNLSRAEVLACLAYYDDYQAEIDRHFREQDDTLQAMATPLDEIIAHLRQQHDQTPTE